MDTNEIIIRKSDISLVNNANIVAFCGLWPEARATLELLKNTIKNPIAQVAIAIVIAAGDAICSN